MSDKFNKIYEQSIKNPESFSGKKLQMIFFGLKNQQKF